MKGRTLQLPMVTAAAKQCILQVNGFRKREFDLRDREFTRITNRQAGI